ncbi:hypothetical protein C7S18_23075 [Ahniella affigens]|uniref:Glycosyl transferase n=2 Tax=Ahniella affigens TaxID=2021234 RepID=A0A2P1PYG1_9GAMM|nr:hypothetical protein C7S18_23075 [Ahniella affigens]
MGLGRLWYQLWHRPKARYAELKKHGGWSGYRALQAGQRHLAEAAAGLPARQDLSLGKQSVTLNVMTGARYWDQTSACLWTLAQHSQQHFRIRILDDGSLSAAHCAVLQRLSPELSIQSEAQARARVAEFLPAQRYPTLSGLWFRYKHIRKIIDAHLGRNDFNLVLDSDMLFFARPKALLDYLETPHGGIAMIDCAESYGYPRAELDRLCGGSVPTPVNVGVLGMPSGELDWDHIEYWAKALIAGFGPHYFLEQTLSAMLLAGMPHRFLPRDDYLVIAGANAQAEHTACLVHYVDASKRQYYDRNWQQVFRP